MDETTKILIAEDDKFIGNAFRVKLQKKGYDVILVQDGLMVFEELQKGLPHLIILDLIMPNKDGFETLKELKENDKYKHIPVLITSNLGQPEDVERCTNLGAAEYIIKSDVSLKEIIEKIEHHIT